MTAPPPKLAEALRDRYVLERELDGGDRGLPMTDRSSYVRAELGASGKPLQHSAAPFARWGKKYGAARLCQSGVAL